MAFPSDTMMPNAARGRNNQRALRRMSKQQNIRLNALRLLTPYIGFLAGYHSAKLLHSQDRNMPGSAGVGTWTDDDFHVLIECREKLHQALD